MIVLWLDTNLHSSDGSGVQQKIWVVVCEDEDSKVNWLTSYGNDLLQVQTPSVVPHFSKGEVNHA